MTRELEDYLNPPPPRGLTRSGLVYLGALLGLLAFFGGLLILLWAGL